MGLKDMIKEIWYAIKEYNVGLKDILYGINEYDMGLLYRILF